MSNSNFKTMFVLLVIGIISIWVFRILTVAPKNKETLKAVLQAEDSSHKQDRLVAEKKSMLSNKETANFLEFSESEVQTISELLLPFQFHQDLYIEVKIIIELNRGCFYLIKSKKQCESIRARYTKINGLIKNFQDLQKIPPSTELGDVLKKGVNYDPHQPEAFRKSAQNKITMVLQSQNPYVLGLEAISSYYYHDRHGEVLPITRWLNSQDQVYNSTVLMYSLLTIADRIEPSVVAEPNEFSSMLFCSIERTICDFDFETAYQAIVMPGMQKDVDLLISHLERFAESGEF